jgi:hypothetical protein
MRHRLFRTAILDQQLTKVRPGEGIVRRQLDSPAEMAQGLLDLPEFTQGNTQVAVRGRELRSLKKCASELVYRISLPPHPLERESQVVQCFGVVG